MIQQMKLNLAHSRTGRARFVVADKSVLLITIAHAGAEGRRRIFARTHFPPDMIRLLSAARPANTFMPPWYPTGQRVGVFREGQMRLFFGIILGIALTVGGAYVVDSTAGAGAARMVNWDVVARNVDGVTNFVRDGWRKITG